MQKGKIVIFSAPSGSGKTTLVKSLLQEQDLNLTFSISATSRPPRRVESDGRDYYFLTPENFRQKIEEGAFLEWEEVYPDKYYGTLKSEVDRILREGKNVVFDVDVKGGLSIKKYFGSKALSIFIQPPSIDLLRLRLEIRGTDSPEIIQERIQKAEYELTFANQFDVIIINDLLAKAKEDCHATVKEFLEQS